MESEFDTMEVRLALQELLRETFLSDKVEDVREALETLEEAHVLFHAEASAMDHAMTHLGEEGYPPEQALEAVQVKRSAMSVLHVAIEHFHLLALDHLRNIEGRGNG